MRHINFCQQCIRYTMSDSCPKCGSKAISQKPAKWSPEDKYGSYRRQVKRIALAKKGVL